MSISIEYRGNALDNLNNNIEKDLRRAITRGCLAIERDAKINAPVDTGNLRASITTKVKNLEGEVGTNVNYAGYVEFGTYKQAAQPYLYPAYAQNKNKILNEIKNVVGGY